MHLWRRPVKNFAENICSIQANGRDGFFEKAGEKGECDELKYGTLKYTEKRQLGIGWHQLDIVMDARLGKGRRLG